MIIKTYKIYLIKKFLNIFLKTSLIFSALVFVLNFIEEFNFLQNTDADFTTPFILTLLNIPSVIYDLFPFILLITTQFFYLELSEKNEILIFKSFGLNNSKILSLISMLAFIMGVFIVLVFYNFASKMKFVYFDLKNQFSNDNKYLAVITENGIWIKDETEFQINIINAEKINKNYLENVTVTQFNKDYFLEKSMLANKANILNNTWILEDVSITENKKQTVKVKKFELETHFNIERINSLFSNLSSLTFWQLKKLKDEYQNLGYSLIDIKIHHHKIIAYPVYLLTMVLCAALIMLNIKFNKSKIFHLFLGIFLCVSIYYINYFSNILGQNEKVPVVISIWIPLLLLLMINAISLTRINDN
jgi:lipopolysaccharide export system permease protein